MKDIRALPDDDVIPVEQVDALIVGGGPAGLSAAATLKRAGVAKVVLVERQNETGGIPRHCGHSPFGMREFHRVLSGKRYAARLATEAISAGADIRLMHSVVGISEGPQALVATPEGLRRFEARKILIATGVRETTRAGRLASGSRPVGIFNTGALQDLVHLRGLRPFRRPVIIGTELVSMSAILTCLSAGARPAAIVEGGKRPVVRAPFNWLPALLQIPRHYEADILEILGRSAVEAIVLKNRRTGVITRIACDGVLFTGGFTPEASLARLSGVTIDGGSAGPEIDSFGRTSMAGVYAAGNVLRGVETAGRCWAEGRSVARVMADDWRNATISAKVAVETGGGVKLVVPQSVSIAPSPAFEYLQVRLDSWINGELVIEQGGYVIWKRRLSSGPERRILVPLKELEINDTGAPLRVTANKL